MSAFGQVEVDGEPQIFAARRDLEKQALGAGGRLAQFQIARPEFIRARGLRYQHTQNSEQYEATFHWLASICADLAGCVSTTIS